MNKKFLYNYNSIKSWAGGLGWIQFGSKRVDLTQTQVQFNGLPKKKYIWRNKGDDQYKISLAFEDNPLELSNYLLVRTREHIYLQNKSQKKLGDGKGVAAKAYTQLLDNYYKQALDVCHGDLEEKLIQLQRLFRIKNEEYSLPVAFATNALYILARNGMIATNDRVVSDILIPLLHEKKDYLHGEGLAQTVYALEQSENYEPEIWALLKEKIEDKDFDYVVVKNSRLSVVQFQTMSGSEHLYQAHNDKFTNDLFYSDKLNLFELYNSIKAVSEAAPQLQLEATIESLERKYPDTLLEQNATYLTLNQDKYEPKFLNEKVEQKFGIEPPTDPKSEEIK